jgi:hypothetical protein
MTPLWELLARSYQDISSYSKLLMGRVYRGKSPMFFQSYSHSGKAFIRGYWGESRSFFRFGIGLGYEDGTADWLVRGLLCCFG